MRLEIPVMLVISLSASRVSLCVDISFSSSFALVGVDIVKYLRRQFEDEILYGIRVQIGRLQKKKSYEISYGSRRDPDELQAQLGLRT